MNADMSASMETTPELEHRFISYSGIVNVHGITYDLYYVIMNTAMMTMHTWTMNTDHVDHGVSRADATGTMTAPLFYYRHPPV